MKRQIFGPEAIAERLALEKDWWKKRPKVRVRVTTSERDKEDVRSFLLTEPGKSASTLESFAKTVASAALRAALLDYAQSLRDAATGKRWASIASVAKNYARLRGLAEV